MTDDRIKEALAALDSLGDGGARGAAKQTIRLALEAAESELAATNDGLAALTTDIRMAALMASRIARSGETLARIKRSLFGVVAPCRQCGDALAKCVEQQCCVGCNHANGAPRP